MTPKTTRLTPTQRLKRNLQRRTPEQKQKANLYQRRWRRTHPLTPAQKQRRLERERIRNAQNPKKQKAKRTHFAKKYLHLTKHKRTRKNCQLRRYYNLTLQQYETISTQQNNACAICETPRSQLTRDLAIDHCHTTGRIRGLLCERCNISIGKFHDNPHLLQQAATYLLTQPTYTLYCDPNANTTNKPKKPPPTNHNNHNNHTQQLDLIQLIHTTERNTTCP